MSELEMACSTLTVRVDGAVAEMHLNNGPLNLVDHKMLRELNRSLAILQARPGLRCLILGGGAGRVFCAGSDMRAFEALGDNAVEQKILFEDWVLRRLADLPFPTIAALDGPALGGGLELALACDLRLIRTGTVLGLTESRIGGLAGNGSLRLTRLIGPGRAKEMLYTGEPITAEKALQWGLVNRVTTDSALEEARKMAVCVASRGPLSNRLAKELVDASGDAPLDAGLNKATKAQQLIFDSADLAAGVGAFFSKQQPEFQGG